MSESSWNPDLATIIGNLQETSKHQLPEQTETSVFDEGAQAAFEKTLALEPLLDHPELFSPEHTFSAEDLADYPELQQRYKDMLATAQETAKQKELSTEEAHAEQVLVGEKFNPYRANKVSNVLIWSRLVLRDSFPQRAQELLGEDRYNRLLDEIEELTHIVAEKKNSPERTPITHDEAKAAYTIGHAVQFILEEVKKE